MLDGDLNCTRSYCIPFFPCSAGIRRDQAAEDLTKELNMVSSVIQRMCCSDTLVFS